MKKTFKHSKFTVTFTDADGYFSLTGDCDGSGGAVGDCVAKIYPDLALLNDMHLANRETGAPMHAWANAEYWLRQGKMATLRKHLRVDSDLFDKYVVQQSVVIKAIEERDLDDNPKSRRLKNAKVGILHDKLLELKADIESFWADQVDEVYDLVNSTESNLVGRFVNPFLSPDEFISEDYREHYENSFTDQDSADKGIAVAMEEDIDFLEVEQASWDDNLFMAGGREYNVYTDDEADDAWNESLDNYLDECVLPELPEQMQGYFDREAWKCDARHDGRGHSLSNYDGHERHQSTEYGGEYYLYRR